MAEPRSVHAREPAPPGAGIPAADAVGRTGAVSGRPGLRRGVRRVGSRLRPALRTTLDAAEAATDPVVRPVVTAVQRRRGGRDAQDLLEHYRAGEYLSVGRWGRFVWCEPKRRVLIPIAERRVPKNVARLIRAGRFDVTFDRAFPDVLRHCATVRDRSTTGRPWLTEDLQQVYLRLREQGHAHSVEVWHDDRLVGGELGVAVGGLYSGESMFFLEANASKVGLARLTEHLRDRGFLLFDTQVMTAVGQQFGAFPVSGEEYRARLREALAADVTFD